ncbi:MAG TPA: serine--tRNA ligase, partial [Vicinamibacteria bacterium]
MLDLKYVAENRERVTELLLSRGQTLGETDLWAQDALRRALIVKVETLRHQQRLCGEEIARRGKAKEDASALKAEMKGVADEVKSIELHLEEAESALRELLLTLPNLPDPTVPLGRDAASNVEVRRVGEIPVFDFAPKAHWDLGVDLGILDFERAAKLSGARFSVSWDDGARLERALVSFMLDLHATRGYREVLPPYLVTAQTLTGTGQLPKFEGDLFKTRAGDRDLYLIPTAEVPLTNLHREEILEEGSLPRNYAAFSPCFRSEAGSYGKDVRGLIRQHQFHKVELVKLTTPETSMAELEAMVAD